MLRGLYTSASSMQALTDKMNVISNNLANVSTNSFKREEAIMKEFPTMLLKMEQNYSKIPPKENEIVLKSSPTIGVLGTGVELNESFVVFDQGSLRKTNSNFDFSLQGDGFFAVLTPNGERYTRTGSFTVSQEGLLTTMQGYPVLDENGSYISVKQNNFKVERDGSILTNSTFDGDKNKLVSSTENDWSDTHELTKLKIVNFENKRYLKKEGVNLYNKTKYSGDAVIADKSPVVRQGFLETSNVNPIREMVKMIELQRNYEASQKVLTSQDNATSKLFQNELKV